MKRNSIIIEELERRIRFYQGMSTSSNTADPFDFKNLEIALAEIKNICFRSCNFSDTLFKNVSLSNDARFTNSKIGYITIQSTEVSETRFDSCNIYALRMESTTVVARFLINNCKIRIATLIGSVSAELPYTYFDTLHVKNAMVNLENTNGLSINTLSPYNTTFLPKSQVKVLKRVSKVILPDEYEMNAIASRSTFHGYSKH